MKIYKPTTSSRLISICIILFVLAGIYGMVSEVYDIWFEVSRR